MVDAANHPKTRWLLLSAMLAGCGAAYWITSLPTQGKARDPLVIESRYFDFGDAWEDSRFSWTVPVMNIGRQPVLVLEFAAPCSCRSVSPPSLAIDPGQVAGLTFTFDLVPRTSDNNSNAFETTIFPLLRGRVPMGSGWKFQGRVRSLFEKLPAFVDLGDVVKGLPIQTKTTQFETAVPLENVRVEGIPAAFTAAIKRQGKKEYVLDVSPLSGVPRGFFSFDLVLIGSLPKGERGRSEVRRSLRVKGRTYEQVEAVPAEVLLGAFPLKESRSETITLRSLMGRPFKIEGWQSDPKAIQVERVSANRGTEATFRLTKMNNRLGHERGCATFVIEGSDGARLEVPVDVFSHGLPGACGK